MGRRGVQDDGLREGGKEKTPRIMTPFGRLCSAAGAIRYERQGALLRARARLWHPVTWLMFLIALFTALPPLIADIIRELRNMESERIAEG